MCRLTTTPTVAARFHSGCLLLGCFVTAPHCSYPVYPPMQLQVWVGPSPLQLVPASPLLDVQATDALQTFALYTDAPVAK